MTFPQQFPRLWSLLLDAWFAMLTTVVVLFKPLTVVSKTKLRFFTWVVATIVFGQAGLLGGFFLLQETAALDILNHNLSAANLYTFAISLCVSAITPFIIEYFSEKEPKFRGYKVSLSLVIGIVFFLMSVLFTESLRKSVGDTSLGASGKLDWMQILLYVITIVLCIYAYCVSQLHAFPEAYDELDDKNISALREKVNRIAPIEDGIDMSPKQ